MSQPKRTLFIAGALAILGCSGNDTPFSADGAIQSPDAFPPQQADAGVQPKPDSKPSPLQVSCDPLKEASCPAGQRCGLTSSGAARCFYTAPGDANPGKSCSASGDGDNCVDSHICLSSSASATMCARICDAPTYTGCSRRESCNVPISATYNACSPSCDLLTSDGCQAQATCGVYADPKGGVYKGCSAYGTRTQGESCSSGSPCARNHSCIYWSKPPYLSGWECRQHCDLNGTGPACPGNTTCGSPPNTLEPFGSIDRVGVCR
jgi:hypothetical protein